MRPQKINDEELLVSLTKVFRARGYEGTSLKELSDVTGLRKASLYHRFPNGKQEMAESVLNYMSKWVTDNIFNALNKEGNSSEVRLKNGFSQIRRLYDGGRDSCIFRALSMQNGMELFHQIISKGMNEWLIAFKNLGLSMNLSDQVAEEMALQTLIDIQGSLILSKGLKDTDIFENTLKKIENRYT
ncbi:TetR family transcriptional regulator [Reichenbachiella sp. 5M10]|uniref:TetR/AcrR family transcriptional regulator n=1 Tax=Reichenbachiella sp. 5M10 TaxID=1889772 RepID=UPI000C14C27E|nr:TetR/AcrR family transcriptional regulator [Reichenbachiella sp. 5M10]PIB34097.1 TetR family transcriptional regulator [Reichenbachiella sp. 5M10]